jgi:FkbM family methyltransferase
MKKLLKQLFPRLYARQQSWNHRRKERRLFKQRLVPIQCGDFEIMAPEHHPLFRIKKEQPYRDLCIGIAAQYLSAKYPEGTMVDIGANIGDTAAVIATYAKNRLVLVEASDYYFEILSRNARHLPNVLALKNVLISDGSDISGVLHHWGGTASFHEKAGAGTQQKSQRLSDVADTTTCFVKIDTDGFDFKILRGCLSWLREVQPGFLFECELGNRDKLAEADTLYDELKSAGYIYFTVWDDQGFHLVSTTSLEVLRDLNNYLLKNSLHQGRRAFSNYDVLCLHQKDDDVHGSIQKWYKAY